MRERLVVLLVGTACFGSPPTVDTDSGHHGSSGTTAVADSTGGCVDGLEGCHCIVGGLCVAGLVCASQLCVDVGGHDSGSSGELDGGTAKPSDTGDSSSGGDTGMIGTPGSCADNCGGSAPDYQDTCYCDATCMSLGDCCDDYAASCGDAGCLSNDDCGTTEVCSPTSGCTAAIGATYDLVIEQWRDQTAICWDTFDCLADVYYVVYHGGDEVFMSTTIDDAWTAQWSEPVAMIIDDLDVVSISFSDLDDDNPDDPIVAVCFTDGEGACTPVPVEALHAGTFTWDDGMFEVQVRFLAH